ncbi:CBS domain-containing protein [Metallosphaera tengchongensis]|uniref:CBS domain-containing protein n=1 Tax=Metallosphaera tengchongensis TaxID=1532350 RepID=A0A6N0NVH7_9CREN|nr:CBS domain-containing protein [Metallosphaera tengchongensis]QKQ99159.1 CBS domain-containing protein [Metallosphaera tengchongensis]
MKVKEVMVKDLVRVEANSTLRNALKIMLERGIRRLVVEEQGLVTIRDLVYGWYDKKSYVRDVMAVDLLAVSEDLDLKQATKIMTSKGVGSLLVVSGDKTVGIVTERDLIRNCKVEEDIRVGDVMKIDPLLVSPEVEVKEVGLAMKENWERHAVVVENSLASGVISIRDVGRAILNDKMDLKASSVMSSPVFKVTPDSSLETARSLMSSRNIGFLPVVDPRTLLGSLDEREILAVFSI